jgi:hypothetical protein
MEAPDLQVVNTGVHAGTLLTAGQARQVRAALSVAGLTQTGFAAREGLDKSDLAAMLRGRQPLPARYATALDALLVNELPKLESAIQELAARKRALSREDADA